MGAWTTSGSTSGWFEIKARTKRSRCHMVVFRIFGMERKNGGAARDAPVGRWCYLAF